ncbi:Conserved protein containing a Zn-ribbon-like motif, possibly RNA-binding [Amycolatopsis arida]|uniref:Conserved protein containing a Zn-ribbon-like motif, possibly RNA-binding n=1 Tax=Amycolatopsis arida TaxID=587909 RepID=A0A1I5YD77_9PSEU|nr:ABATE domain-containing protein [Amycolatopsis arida]TDX90432.1 putative RNA-binding Zn ribbon-like protein [Amycolatopsis arida]SFQ42142.1 Conserved protein containing a Zn-ribbon-like motif, possibly RNA-binding [Amycolatopsis arida]
MSEQRVSDWVFDGGRPCLDLVNTLRDRERGGRELLTGPAALAEWLAVAGLVGGRAGATEEQVVAARELREAVDRVVRSTASGQRPRPADVRRLNTTAGAARPPAPQLRITADGIPRRVTPAPDDPVAAALAMLAVDAIELAADGTAVRVCAAEDCGLRFADTSPQRNRQWCSMARCGNRAKARAHYARRRGTR